MENRFTISDALNRLLAFILLLCHLNTAMFFPVMEEQLFINDSGEHTNGINSVAEFVDVVILNHKQKSPDSDDQPPFFHIVKAGLNYFVPLAYEMRPAVTVKPEKRHYPEYSERLLPVISAEIFVPPPEA